jgi:hypothetical protein
MPVNPSFGPRLIYPNFSKVINVASGAASTTASTLVSGATGWTIYVTRVSISVTQDGATQLKISDTTGSLIVQGIPSPGLVEVSREFGEDGVPCTEGYGLQYNFTTAATAFACKGVVEGYMKQTSPLSAAAYASTVLP